MAEDTTPGISVGTYVQAAFALLVIIGLLAGTAWFARKVSGGKGFGHGGMKVIGGIALGPRERVVLIEAGDQWLVIGIVPGQIRTLHSMPRGQLAEPAEGAPGEGSFAHWLKAISEQRRT